jgi:hypothetical protein
MREHARNYVIYLRRRVDDYAEPDRPIPKWTDLDHEAVRTVLDEVDWLQRANVKASEMLRKHGLQSGTLRITSGDRDVRFDGEVGWRLLLLAAGITCGAFLREIIEMF